MVIGYAVLVLLGAFVGTWEPYTLSFDHHG
jgi:hypothetical protein